MNRVICKNLFDKFCGTKALSTVIHEDDNITIERKAYNGYTNVIGKYSLIRNDQWWMVLQGEAVISFKNGDFYELRAGDHTVIKANARMKLESASKEPACIIICIHYGRA